VGRPQVGTRWDAVTPSKSGRAPGDPKQSTLINSSFGTQRASRGGTRWVPNRSIFGQKCQKSGFLGPPQKPPFLTHLAQEAVKMVIFRGFGTPPKNPHFGGFLATHDFSKTPKNRCFWGVTQKSQKIGVGLGMQKSQKNQKNLVGLKVRGTLAHG
jgi:hypothetical protein